MQQTEDIAVEWGGKRYRAVINHDRVAVIAANTRPVDDEPTDFELHRLADDGGLTS